MYCFWHNFNSPIKLSDKSVDLETFLDALGVWSLRELKEEIGTDRAELVAERQGWLRYDLPEELRKGARHRGWRGQRQKWFVMRFTGKDADIDVATEHPEFDAWRWLPPYRLPEVIVPFKRQLYLDILIEFRVFCGTAGLR